MLLTSFVLDFLFVIGIPYVYTDGKSRTFRFPMNVKPLKTCEHTMHNYCHYVTSENVQYITKANSIFQEAANDCSHMYYLRLKVKKCCRPQHFPTHNVGMV